MTKAEMIRQLEERMGDAGYHFEYDELANGQLSLMCCYPLMCYPLIGNLLAHVTLDYAGKFRIKTEGRTLDVQAASIYLTQLQAAIDLVEDCQKLLDQINDQTQQ